MNYSEEQMNKIAVKALEANIWNVDHYLQGFFLTNSLEDIKIAHEWFWRLAGGCYK